MSHFPDPIPGILPFGTVTVFAGAPGAGKTTLLADWCRSWRDGLPILGHATTRPTAFAYICGDRRWASYAPMFEAVGFADIPHYVLAEDASISLADLRKPFKAHDRFDKALDALQVVPGTIVLVDPAAPLYITGDTNRTCDVASSLIGFSRRCSEREITILATAHFSKQKADPRQRYLRPQDRISGSTSFAGFSDTQIYLIDAEPPKQPYSTLGWVPRHGAPQEFKLVRDPETGLFVPFDAERHDTGAEETLQALLSVFPAPPDRIGLDALLDAAKTAQKLSRAKLFRLLQALIQQGRVLRMGRGKYRLIKPA